MVQTNFTASSKNDKPDTRKPAAPAPEPEKKPADDGVPEGSIKEVLDWVGDDAGKAQEALDAENAKDKPRSSLVKQLEEQLTAPDDDDTEDDDEK